MYELLTVISPESSEVESVKGSPSVFLGAREHGERGSEAKKQRH
jgi:hypothetical protein